MYCITGTRKGLVDMPYRFRISPQESWGTYFVCTSCGVRLNFVIALRLMKRYPAMPANVARSLLIHSRDTKTVWHVDQTLPRAGDAIHPVLWKRCGFQTSRYVCSLRPGITEHEVISFCIPLYHALAVLGHVLPLQVCHGPISMCCYN